MIEPVDHSSARCPRCDGPLAPGLLGGRCPACLADAVWDEEPLAEAWATPGPTGRNFGAYVLEEELGRGAMGVVFRAWQPSLRRHVAVKLLLGGAFAGAEFTARFRQEAAVAAGLRHPGLVAIHEAGEVEGQLFYAMEWIEGLSLAARLRQGPLPARDAARLLADVAVTVAYAHRQGVVHRDLKPSNLLLDALGQPRVADFGLARRAEADSELTGSSDALGSPPYMAPEQTLAGAEASALADVYALGAVLYHTLTGRPPFQGASAAQVLQQVANEPPISPRRLNPAVPVDLETICLKCLEKEPARRYASADALAADLERFLAGRPVVARPVGLMGRSIRWARRKPALAAALAGLAVTLFCGTGAVAWQARRNAVIAAELRREGYFSGIRSASLELAGDELSRAATTLDALPAEERGFEWHWLRARAQSPEIASWPGHGGIVLSAAMSPDGRWLATGDQGGPASSATVKLWELTNQTVVAQWSVPGQPFSLGFLPDGQRLVVGLGREGVSEGVLVFGRGGGPDQPEKRFPGALASVSADGRRLATVETDFYFYWRHAGAVRVFDLETSRELLSLPGPARAVALSADGETVAFSGKDGRLRRVRVADGAVMEEVALGSEAWSLVFSPDGGEIAGVLANGQAFRHRAGTTRLLPHPQRPWAARYSPDGTRLATVANDYTVRFWPSDGLPDTLHGAADEQWCVAWSPKGDTLVSAGKDGRILHWSTTPKDRSATREIAHASQRRPIFSPDGRWMAVERGIGESRLLETDGTNAVPLPDGFIAVWLGAEANEVAAVDGVTRRMVWLDRATLRETGGVPTAAIKDGWFEGTVAFAADGGRWVEVTADGALQLREARSGREISQARVPRPKVPAASDTCHLAMTPDAGWVAWADAFSREIHLWRTTGGQARTLVGHTLGVKHLAFSPDGRLLASASLDHTIRLWSVADGQTVRVLRGHWAQSNGVGFSPDGRTLASVEHRDALKFWDVATGRELCSVPGKDWGESLAFSPDGRWLGIGLSRDQGDGLRLLRGAVHR